MEDEPFEQKGIRSASRNRLLVFVSGAVFLALVNLLVATQIRHHREVSPTALDVTRECCNRVSTYSPILIRITYASRQCDCTCESAAKTDG